MYNRPIMLLIEDILEAIEKIERYIKGMAKDEFIRDNKTTDAVVRNLEIIGEATNRLFTIAKDLGSDIQWNKIIGLRNRIVHEYFGVDLEIIWQIIQRDLPTYKNQIKCFKDKQN